MPQYIILAHDGTDSEAPARRLAQRPAHIAAGDKARQAGEMLCALALLDASGNMNGSLLVLNLPDRQAVDSWLASEPYVIGKVWETITVLDAKIGPTFQDLIK